jgi:glutamate-1-semialdehyde 2,1-aminomutase
LCGRKDLFDLGLRGKGNVFLMSGTYFSETTGLAASIATIKELQDKNVPEYIWKLGQDFSDKLRHAIYKAKMDKYMQINDWMPCNPSIQYATYDNKFTPLELKTLFDQEIIKQGILMPYISISASHDDKEIQQTIEASEYALNICKKAIEAGNVKDCLIKGWVEKPVFRACQKV